MIVRERVNTVTDDALISEIQDLTPDEREEIYNLIQALKRSRISPLAFIEEMMHFEGGREIEPDRLYEHKMEVTKALKNRFDMLHGGITATFIDTAMGATVYQMTGSTNGAVTLDLNVNFLNPARIGWLTAKTEVVKKGGTIVVMHTRVFDENDVLIATASGTFFRLKHLPASKS